jgi:hypothetical protein
VVGDYWELYSSMLKNISKAIQQGWEEKYKKNKYNALRMFQLHKVNQEKTRKPREDPQD